MTTTHEHRLPDAAPVPLPAGDDERRDVLIVEPNSLYREQVERGLRALGYRPHAFASTSDLQQAPRVRYGLVLTGVDLRANELNELDKHLATLGETQPPTRSLRALFPDADSAKPESRQAGAETSASTADTRPWSEGFKIQVLRWVAEEGPGTLRPVPCPAVTLGHAYPRLEDRFGIDSSDAIRALEDMADFGVLRRALSNRVHVCPHCRRWTINFRETCPMCASLDVEVEGMIHHFACSYVGLDSEYRSGAELICPKCKNRLTHIGLDYERPRQTYVCHACAQIFEEPTITSQCLDCRWEGMSGDVLAWPVYEYELSARGQEAVERGELRGLKLREMIRTSRYDLASREFFELELERETFRLRRYGRPMSILICRFQAGGMPYALFREADREALQAFARLIVHQVRALDVAAMADATAIAILLPETDDRQAEKAKGRLQPKIDGFEMAGARQEELCRQWILRSWTQEPDPSDEPLLWFQQQLELQRDEA